MNPTFHDKCKSARQKAGLNVHIKSNIMLAITLKTAPLQGEVKKSLMLSGSELIILCFSYDCQIDFPLSR